MSDSRWLGDQLEQAAQEVQSWDAWKREAMRREATAISTERDQDGRRAVSAPLLDNYGPEH